MKPPKVANIQTLLLSKTTQIDSCQIPNTTPTTPNLPFPPNLNLIPPPITQSFSVSSTRSISSTAKALSQTLKLPKSMTSYLLRKIMNKPLVLSKTAPRTKPPSPVAGKKKKSICFSGVSLHMLFRNKRTSMHLCRKIG